MGLRQVGFNDTSITGGFKGVESEKKYRAKKGRLDYIVFKTEPVQYMVHQVDDIYFNESDGEFTSFNTPCSKVWNQVDEQWTGECVWCEEEYNLKERYICLILKIAEKKGQRLQKIAPENSTMYWDFAGKTYETLRTTYQQTKGGLLDKVVAIDCTDTNWQNINAAVCDLDEIVSIYEEQREDFDEQSEVDGDLPEKAVSPDPISRQRNKIAQRNKRNRDVGNTKLGTGSNFESKDVVDADSDNDLPFDDDSVQEINDEELERILNEVG